MTEWVTMREWARQGVAVSEIARRSGRDPKTVRKVLQAERPAARKSTWKVGGHKLAPYEAYLVGRLEQGCWNAAVLYEEIAKQGYPGKLSRVRDFVRPRRQERVRQQAATVRFETEPGQQAQVDWSEFGQIWVPERQRWTKLYGFVFTLGYSRAQYLEFTTRCDLEHFLGCHLGAFGALGIPAQVLYDNLKTAIVGRQADGTPVLPGRFADFALYYGFTPKFCQPYRARTKGKVERGIGYVKQNFWVRVAAAIAAQELTLGGLNERAREWVATVAQVRCHGTTRAIVAERLAEEQPRLGRLDARPVYDPSYRAARRVSRDGRFSYRGQSYQVPLRHALTTVEVVETLAGHVAVRTLTGTAVLASRLQFDRLAHRPLDRAGDLASARPPVTSGPPAPPVAVRALAVYEEVARAAGTR